MSPALINNKHGKKNASIAVAMIMFLFGAMAPLHAARDFTTGNQPT
jgi:hypothetical protein